MLLIVADVSIILWDSVDTELRDMITKMIMIRRLSSWI